MPLEQKKLNKLIAKYHIRNIILDLFYYSIIFLSAYLFDKWLEMLCYVIAYTLIRSEFTKAVHGSDFTESHTKAIKYCRRITFVVQLASLIFIISVNISRYVNLMLAVVLGYLNFFVKDYLEFYVVSKLVFFKGMSEDDIPVDLVGTERTIMVQYYVKRYKLDKIAFNVGYSVDNVKKIKSKIIKRYS